MALAGRLAGRGLYYGWYVAAVAFLAQWVSGLGRAGPLSVFLKPMVAELGWTRGLFSTADSVGNIVIGLTGLLAGGLLDRRGARGFFALGGFLCGAGMIALSQVDSLWQFFLIKGVVIATGSMGVDRMVAGVSISNWFIRRRGLALALAMMGFPLAAAVMTPVATFLVQQWGWRTAWVFLGLFTWLVLIAPALLLVRRRPEELGLHPDGQVRPEGGVSSHGGAKASGKAQPGLQTEEALWTRRQTLSTFPFWTMTLTFSTVHMTAVALVLHLIPFATDIGLSLSLAALMVSLRALSGAFVRPLWGYLLEFLPVRYVAGILYLGATVSLLFFIWSREPSVLFLAAALNGITINGSAPVQEMMWASYFGRASLGTVRSLEMPVTFTVAACGPVLAGFMFDITGSYSGAFAISAGMLGVMSVVLFLARPPLHPSLGLGPGH